MLKRRGEAGAQRGGGLALEREQSAQLRGGAPNMCSKKFSVVKSGPPQAKFFLELWSRALGTSWGVAF